MPDIYRGYLDLDHEPDPDSEITVSFYFETKDEAENAAQGIAAESSIGTWTTLGTMKERIWENLRAKVYELDKKNGLMKIAYPLDLFEPDNIPQFLSDVAGNIFGIKDVTNIRVLDFSLPKSYVKSFRGPEIGLDGVREMMGTSDRPHLGTIVKPKVGLDPEENAEVAYEAWVGGIDFVKDDENLSNQPFCPFDERVIRTLEARDRAVSETGEEKMYAPNITAKMDEMVRRAQFVKDHGGNCIMIDIVTSGFSALQSIRDMEFGMPIHAHRAMYAAFARNEKHGISMLALAKLARLAGVDQLHTGAILGKMEGAKKDVLEINKSLTDEWFGLKRVFPVASGGLNPLKIPPLLDIAGLDLVINAGGGVHGHPDGTRAGGKAMREALASWQEKVPIKDYIKDHEALRKAYEKWGKKD